MLAGSVALAIATTFGGGALVAGLDASPAAAARPTRSPLATQIPCTVAGVATTCTLRVTSLQVVNGALQATGTVTNGTISVPFTDAVDPTCPVLSLTLGPLHLDLLGLVVDLNQVVLNITAVPGPGNLLGNLLCAVTNLLNGNPASTALTQLLNQINAILAGL